MGKSFLAQSGDTVLYAVWGSELAVWYGGQPRVADCQSYLASGAYSIVPNGYMCYQTGSDNYLIWDMFLDLDALANSYVELSCETEVFPKLTR